MIRGAIMVYNGLFPEYGCGQILWQPLVLQWTIQWCRRPRRPIRPPKPTGASAPLSQNLATPLNMDKWGISRIFAWNWGRRQQEYGVKCAPDPADAYNDGGLYPVPDLIMDALV